MFSLESLPGLFTRLSLTTHRNFAKVLAFAVPISRSVVWHALSRLHTVLFSAGRFATSKVRLLPQQPVALGLLAVLSILIVIAPTSVQALKGKWSPVSLSAPQQANDLVSNLPRASNETSALRQTETTPARDGLLRKTSVYPVWVLIFTGLAFTLITLTARFKKAAATLRDWFRYLFQLLDLPPPLSITASA